MDTSNPYMVLLHLAGAITLLLWAVRMVRTGVERSQEPALKRLLRESRGGQLRAAAIGAGGAMLLQSSTAVALLASGFAASGTISLATGLAMMLGADLGSAIVVRILSIDVHWLSPLLLVVGGFLFFRGPSRTWRQSGRVVFGIALVLVSLQMIGEATAPLRDTPLLPEMVGYLKSDFFTAFLLGAAFTWLVHSSVASLLLIATFAGQGMLPAELAVSLVLGANLGGGLIALGLTRGGAVEARRIAIGNCLFRGLGAMLGLVVVNFLHPPLTVLAREPAQLVINLHLAFNFALMVLCLPLTSLVGRLLTTWIRAAAMPDLLALAPASCLDQSVVDRPALALASAKRELLRMAEIIERMLTPLMELYETGDPEKIRQIKALERMVDKAQQDIKLYLTQIRHPDMQDEERRRAQDLATFAINLEYIGDTISKTLVKLAETRRNQQLSFSPAGWRELNDMHYRVLQNMHLALNVLTSEDRESARLLLAEKEEMRKAEGRSALEHLRRLQGGTRLSIDTSNIHLETLRSLKTINSLFASVAYPILDDGRSDSLS